MPVGAPRLAHTGSDDRPDRGRRFHLPRRPGPRVVLVAAVVGCVLGASALTAEVVSDHVRQSATDEAVHSAESVVHGFVDPLLTEGAMAAPGSASGQQIGRASCRERV